MRDNTLPSRRFRRRVSTQAKNRIARACGAALPQRFRPCGAWIEPLENRIVLSAVSVDGLYGDMIRVDLAAKLRDLPEIADDASFSNFTLTLDSFDTTTEGKVATFNGQTIVTPSMLSNGVIPPAESFATTGVFYFGAQFDPREIQKAHNLPSKTIQGTFKYTLANGGGEQPGTVTINVAGATADDFASGMTSFAFGTPDALKANVGVNGENRPLDVYRVQQRLRYLAFPSADLTANVYPDENNYRFPEVSGIINEVLDSDPTVRAIKLFEAATRRDGSGNPANTNIDGRIGAGATAEAVRWLNARNAPRWLELMDPGDNTWDINTTVVGAAQYERFGTSWAVEIFKAAADSTDSIEKMNGMSENGFTDGHTGEHKAGLDVDVQIDQTGMPTVNNIIDPTENDKNQPGFNLRLFYLNPEHGISPAETVVVRQILAFSDVAGYQLEKVYVGGVAPKNTHPGINHILDQLLPDVTIKPLVGHDGHFHISLKPPTIDTGEIDMLLDPALQDRLGALGAVGGLVAGVTDKAMEQGTAHKLPLVGNALKDQDSRLAQVATGVQDAADELATLGGAGGAGAGGGGPAVVGQITADDVREAFFNALHDLLPGVAGAANLDLQFVDTDGDLDADALLLNLDLHGVLFEGTFTPTFDLGVLEAALQLNGKLNVSATYDLHLGVGVDAGGFYIDTSANENSGGPEVALNLNLTPEFGATGKLGFLQASATTIDGAPNGLAGTVTADFTDGNDDKLRLEESFSVAAKLTADADLNLHFDLGFGDTADPAQSAYPSLVADLVLNWPMADIVLDSANPDNDKFDLFGTKPTFEFQKVGLRLGGFIKGFIGGVVEQVQDFLEPLEPLRKALKTPIPVISDYAVVRDLWWQGTRPHQMDDGEWDADHKKIVNRDGQITLLEFLGYLVSRDPERAKLAENVLKFVQIWDKVMEFKYDSNTGVVYVAESFNLGDFDVRGAQKFPEDPAGDPSFGYEAGDYADNISDLTRITTGFGQGVAGRNQGKDLFRFPLFDLDPQHAVQNVANLIMGKDVSLVELNLPEIGFDVDLKNLFKIGPFLWVLYVSFDVNFGANLDLSLGYDTRGFRHFFGPVDGDTRSPVARLMDGFYVVDKKDDYEAKLRATADAKLSLDVYVANGWASGGITGELGVDLNDWDETATIEQPYGHKVEYDDADEGRVHLDEMAKLWELGGLSALFGVDVRVSFHVKAGWEAFWVFKGEETLVDTTLFTVVFGSTKQAREADKPLLPVLAHLEGDQLVLHVGPNAGLRLRGDMPEDETITVVPVEGKPDTVKVIGFGTVEEWPGVKSIFADGGTGNDSITIEAGVAIPVTLRGGAGNDSLTAGDAAASELYGGADNDSLMLRTGGNAYGEAGDDRLMGGAGGDYLDGGIGSDTLKGGSGDDRLMGGAGGDYLDGGIGSDTLIGGSGDDFLMGGGDGDLLQGEDGNDTLLGDFARDTAPAAGGEDTTLGSVGADTIDGGLGADRIAADDLVLYDTGRTVMDGTNVAHVYAERWGTEPGADDIRAEVSDQFVRAQNGADTVHLVGPGSLDFRGVAEPSFTGVNVLDLNTTDANRLVLDLEAAQAITDGDHTLLVTGGQDDVVQLNGMWSLPSAESIGGKAYRVFASGESVVKVAPGVTVELVYAPLGPHEGVTAQPLGFTAPVSFRDQLQTVSWSFGDNSSEFFPGDDPRALSRTHIYTQTCKSTGVAYYLIMVDVLEQPDPGDVLTQSWTTAFWPVIIYDRMLTPDGMLYIGGSTKVDKSHVSPGAGGKVNYFSNGRLVEVYPNFVRRVYMYGGDENDVLDASYNINNPNDSSNFRLPVEFHGGAGNDLMRGGMGDDLLFGDAGNDRLEGREGNDILVGGAGNDTMRGVQGWDILIGGAGADWLFGDEQWHAGGQDLLITGSTDYDDNVAALEAIRAEWTKTAVDYGVRTANLAAGVLGGTVFLRARESVRNDGDAVDWIFGYGDRDWFFASRSDKITDQRPDEQVVWI